MWNESESRDVSNRVSENQNPGETRNWRDILKCMFKIRKMEISSAIQKTFPFLETLHDHDIITDKEYKGLNNDFRKGVPVFKVVYNALVILEKNFQEFYLEILFSDIHLTEYPGLQKIRDDFKEVTQKRGEGAQEISSNLLTLDQGADENLPGSPTFMDQNATTPNGRKPGNTQPPRRKRGPRIPRDINMNFQLPELPVTCGQAKGTLYKEKMLLGSSALCILAEDKKTWLTLRQFEIKGGMEKSKNWRVSVRCGGLTLKKLIEEGHLLNPSPRKNSRTKQMPFQDALYDPSLAFPGRFPGAFPAAFPEAFSGVFQKESAENFWSPRQSLGLN